MADPIVFRSDRSEVVEPFVAWQEERRAFGARLAEVTATVIPDGQERGMLTQSGWGDIRAVGVEALPDDIADPPNHWKVIHGRGPTMLVPDRRYKDGKEADRLISACKVQDPTTPGMPVRAHGGAGDRGGLRIYSPLLTLLDGCVYSKWNGDASFDDQMWSGEGVDLTIWERVPLSEFYALMEKRDQAEVAS